MILTSDELRLLTNKRRSSAQVRELRLRGIPYRIRSDGTAVVPRDDLVASRNQSARTPKLRLG